MYSANYQYRAYLTDLLKFDGGTKKTQLAAQGWSDDSVGYYDSDLNKGWRIRRARFLQSAFTRTGHRTELAENQFREDPVSFFGRLKTNYESTCNQGLIPNTELGIHILFSEPDFPIWKAVSKDEDYILRIERCILYVPVAVLNIEINNKLEKRLRQSAARYYYRELR
jgi:hypothetical protein